MTKTFEPLPRIEVIKAVERRYPRRIPLVLAKFWGEGFQLQHGEALSRFDKFPEDVVMAMIDPIRFEEMDLPWTFTQSGAHDARNVLDDWGKLDVFIDHFPKPEGDPYFEKVAIMADYARENDLYFIFGWWGLFFERPWAIRGMTNLLQDFVINPEKVHSLYDALCETYLAYLRYAIREFSPDGFLTSDDLGHQKQMFVSQKMFRAFHKPRYERIGALLKEHGIHWWLHSCGNNYGIMGDLADAGVNVFHPVQKHTMDERKVAQEFGDRMTFLAGLDIQQILPHGTPEEVRAEVRFLIDTFDHPEGGMCIAAGNGILPDTPLENIEAFLEEALIYGERKRDREANRLSN
jgi:uroporphyrinogen decarboxylase